MPYALDEAARPLFLVSTMAMHTQNLAADPHATLMVADLEAANDPLGSARASVVGTVMQVPPADLQAARELYLDRHESSRYWVDFKDFAFYRLEPAEVYYIGGFGVMGWISAEDYTHAEPDPLSASAADILAHMNADHADSLVLLAHVFANIKAEAATMTGVDRLGFHVRLTTADGVRGARVGFLREARDAGAVRKVLVEMVTLARQAPPAQH